jgi:hypothetical protein
MLRSRPKRVLSDSELALIARHFRLLGEPMRLKILQVVCRTPRRSPEWVLDRFDHHSLGQDQHAQFHGPKRRIGPGTTLPHPCPAIGLILPAVDDFVLQVRGKSLAWRHCNTNCDDETDR